MHGRGLGARGLPVPAKPAGRDEEGSHPSAKPLDFTPRATRTHRLVWGWGATWPGHTLEFSLSSKLRTEWMEGAEREGVGTSS